MPTVFVQNWVESERGWGTRPDGFSVHPNRAHRDAFVSWYNRTYNNQTHAPDCYTRAAGDPIEVTVSNDVYIKVVAATALKPDNEPGDVVAVWGHPWYGAGTVLDDSLFNEDA